MDKFGIFKLLTSFYDYYQKNKGESNEQKKEQNASSLPFNLDFLTNKPKSKKDNENVNFTNKNSNQSLYLSMVNTISSHDKIVKRVTENANKTKT